LAGKRLEILKETVPGLFRAAMLVDPSSATDAHVREAEVTARNLGIELHVVKARSPGELEPAFRGARQRRAEAVTVVATGLTNSHRAQIIIRPALGCRRSTPIEISHSRADS
jgi:putative ABC transport system substrate-binding protein